jgi:hypothetical protein
MSSFRELSRSRSDERRSGDIAERSASAIQIRGPTREFADCGLSLDQCEPDCAVLPNASAEVSSVNIQSFERNPVVNEVNVHDRPNFYMPTPRVVGFSIEGETRGFVRAEYDSLPDRVIHKRVTWPNSRSPREGRFAREQAILVPLPFVIERRLDQTERLQPVGHQTTSLGW